MDLQSQIDFIVRRQSKSDVGAGSATYEAYEAVIQSLTKMREAEADRNALMEVDPFKIFINEATTRKILSHGFKQERFDDAYSGAQFDPIFYKRVGKDEYRQHWTVIITKCEITIEIEYDYGGGQAGNRWSFTENDALSFGNAYGEMFEYVKNKNLQ